MYALPHDHGLSHLEIDLDLARAFAPDDVDGAIVTEIERTIARLSSADQRRRGLPRMMSNAALAKLRLG